MTLPFALPPPDFPLPAYVRRAESGLIVPKQAVLPGLIMPPGLMGRPVIPGSISFDTPGAYIFVVPNHNELVIELWGGGGGGGSTATGATSGGNGGDSEIDALSLRAGGGTGGGARPSGAGSAAGGPGGIASGGDININGQAGGTGNGKNKGGDAPNGGRGGAAPTSQSPGHGNPGESPGGGGSGTHGGDKWGGGGGSGAYVKKTYPKGALAPGASLLINVGDGGVGTTGGVNPPRTSGSGAPGRIKFSWT